MNEFVLKKSRSNEYNIRFSIIFTIYLEVYLDFTKGSMA